MTPKNNRPTTAGDTGRGSRPDDKETSASKGASIAPRTPKTAGPPRQTPPATRGLLLRQERSALSNRARRRDAATEASATAAPTSNPVDQETITVARPSASRAASHMESDAASTLASTSPSIEAITTARDVANTTASTGDSDQPRSRGRRTTVPDPAAAFHPDADSPSSPPPAKTTKQPRTRTVTTKAAAQVPDPRLDEKKAVTFYIDTALRKRLKLFADKKHMSQTLVTLHALSLPDAKLAELVEQDQQSQVVESLDRFGVILKPRGDLNEAKQQVGMRMTPRQLQVIDELRDKAGARDRSHLINLALREYLDQN